MLLVAMASMASEVAIKEIGMETWQFWFLIGVLVFGLNAIFWTLRDILSELKKQAADERKGVRDD